MAYSDKGFSNASVSNAANQTITTLNGLPSIPSNAILDSVVLSFTCYRKNGPADNEIRVQLGDTIHFYVQDLKHKTDDPRTVNITSIVNNNNGNLTYINGSTSLSLKAWHNWTLINATWNLSNINIRANYHIPTYTVTWKNADGTVLETDTGVAYGATPTYNGSTPAKAYDSSYHYTYAGWSPAVSGITGNTTYTATFNSVAHSYTATVTTQPTCTVTGVRTYTCSCGHSYTETIPAIGHNYTSQVIAATAAVDGYTLHTCQNGCGSSYKDNYTINKIFIGTSQPKKIYFGTQEVKEVYIDVIKVYGAR